MKDFIPKLEPKILLKGRYKTSIFKSLFIFSKENHNESRNVLVNDIRQAYALLGSVKIEDINLKYISLLIHEEFNANTLPYKHIKKVPRYSIVNYSEDNSYEIQPFDPYLKNNAKNNTLEDIRSNLKLKINQIKNIKNIKVGCEHSSGIDSNSILGFLLKEIKIRKNNIYTYSYEHLKEKELINQYRKFFHLVPENCLSDKLGDYSFIDNNKEIINIMGSPSQIGLEIQAFKKFRNSGVEVIFSGLGGDQGLSNFGKNLYTDLALDFNFRRLRELSGSSKSALKIMLSRFYGSINRNWAIKKVLYSYPKKNSFLSKYLTINGKELFIPMDSEYYPWSKDPYINLKESIKKSISQDWLFVRAEEENFLSSIFGMKKYFPFLNRDLINILLNIDSNSFVDKDGKGRYLARKIFSNYLPSSLKEDARKDRFVEVDSQKNEAKFAVLKCKTFKMLDEIHEIHPLVRSWFEIEKMSKDVSEIIELEKIPFFIIFDINNGLSRLLDIHYWISLIDS